MIENIVLGIIVFFILYFCRTKKALQLAFILITIFLSIRYDWGNDYEHYLEQFEIYKFSGANILSISDMAEARGFYNEWGWVFLNLLFDKLRLGFFGLVIFLTIVENFILYKLIRKYVNPQMYWMACLIYIFTFNIFVVGASMMRQYFCMIMYMLAADLLIENKKNIYKAIIIIFACSVVHHMNILMILTIPIFLYNIPIKKKNNLNFFILFLYLIWFFIGPKLFKNNIESILKASDSLGGLSYLNDATEFSGLGLGIIFRFLIYGAVLYIIPYAMPKEKILLKLFLVAAVIEPLAFGTQMLSRIAMYFTIFAIIVWPLLWKYIPNRSIKIFLWIGYVLVTLNGFYNGFTSALYIDKVYEFHTIFEVPWQ